MYQRNIRRKWTIVLAVFALTFVMQQALAQHSTHNDSVATTVSDTIDNDSAMAVIDADLNAMDPTAQGGGGLHKMLKQKFIEGSAGFMSLVALALIAGLAFCIERIL